MRCTLDARNRPIITLTVNHQSIVCLIDTGYTGNLAIGLDCARSLGIEPEPERFSSETAGSRAGFKIGSASIRWFDRAVQAQVHVWEAASVGPVDGILGVNFLVGYILTVDFNEGEVSIQDPATVDD